MIGIVNSDKEQLNLINQISQFVNSLQTSRIGEFYMCRSGQATLYASCFAVMTLHYLGKLSQLSPETREQWVDYIVQWQNPKDGYFLGPELRQEEITSVEHNWDVVRMHLAAHVLPALDLLDKKPTYPLFFARPFLDIDYLQNWLAQRDWRQAWLEGNNLLFVGQFLVHMRDVENELKAQKCIDLYFNWLDEHVDPRTGLWGTDNFFSLPRAIYGAYHQLLVYFFEEHPFPYPERLVDSTLELQALDGGFSPAGGGGACEDVDAIDILVNMYQQYDYKRPKIRRALRKAHKSVLKRMTPDGGFVYKWNIPFIHMSIPQTYVPANTPHLFATWFGVHTLALLAEILSDESSLAGTWQFNRVLSMGWHRSRDRDQHPLSNSDRQAELEVPYDMGDIKRVIRAVAWQSKRILTSISKRNRLK